MTTEENIIQQKQLIEKQLTPLIDNDYYLLDVPYHSNIGDSLIWEGELCFLRMLPFKCLGNHSCHTFDFPEIDPKCIILLHGGGNFGDLYSHHQQFRKRVIETYPQNKIIMLPQTVYYQEVGAIREDSKVFRKHKKLYLCARDKDSFHFLNRYHYSCYTEHILLLPDMAFCIDKDSLTRIFISPTNPTLLFQRVDKEKADINDFVKTLSPPYDVSDWPNYNVTDPLLRQIRNYINCGQFREADRIAIDEYLPIRLKAGIELISQYQKVYSNRLHGAILSLLLGKDVTIIDNNYGKNIHYYETWLKGTSNTSAIRVPRSIFLKRAIKLQIALLLIYLDILQE